MKVSPITRLLALLLLFPCWTLAASDPTDFNGHFVWTSNRVEAAALATEVNETVKTLLFILRPIARPRLTQSTAPYASFDITLGAGHAIQFAGPNAATIHGKLGGTVKWRGEEDVLQDVSFLMTEEGKLQQTLSESDGTRVHLFTLAPDKTNLTMEVTIHSKRLDRLIKYSLTYVKVAK